MGTIIIGEKSPAYKACISHNGEHPFFWNRGVGAYVTYCQEVYDSRLKYPNRR